MFRHLETEIEKTNSLSRKFKVICESNAQVLLEKDNKAKLKKKQE